MERSDIPHPQGREEIGAVKLRTAKGSNFLFFRCIIVGKALDGVNFVVEMNN